MPRIPTITGGGSGAAVYQAGRGQGVGGDPLGTLPQGAAILSGSLSDIAARIKQQSNETELIKNVYSYDPDLQRIRKDVLVDPTVDDPFITFNERAQELQQTYLDGIKDPRVRQAFQNHVNKTFPQEQQNALDDVLKLQTQRNIAGLHELGDTLSTVASTGSPEVRDKAIADYNEKVDSSERSRTINPIQAADAKKTFRVTVMTKNMTAMALDDPYKLFELNRTGAYNEVDPVVRLRALNEARLSVENDQKRIDSRFKEAQTANEKYYGNRANQGAITDAELDMMIKGEHPYITDPVLIRTLAHVNANPIAGPSTQVEAIMLDYHAMSMASPEKVLEAAQKARTELDHYRRTMTHRDPALDKAYHALQQAELTISAAERATRGEARAERGEKRAEASAARAEASANETAINKEIKVATELYKTTAKPMMPGMIGKFQKSREIVDLNEIHGLIRDGMKAKDAVDLIAKKREKEAPRGNSRVQELVPK